MNKKIMRAIGGIDDDLIERAAPKEKVKRVVTFAPWLKWAMPIAACLVIAVAVMLPQITQPNYGSITGAGDTGGVLMGAASENGAALPPPSLTLDSGSEFAACYTSPAEWRGLPAENFILDGDADGSARSDRIVFQSLDDLADYADTFVLVFSVREVAPDSDNMQTAIAEYTETIGDNIVTRQWDDHTVSTGSRVLIRQQLIGGCTMDEPSNLLRKGGIYVLPLKFNKDLAAYEVMGDLDVLFELDSEGKMVSHSRFPGLNQYDGMTLPEFLDEVRGLYAGTDVTFAEQPILSAAQAEDQVRDAYIASGFRKFSIEFDSAVIVLGADVYLFKVSFGDDGVNGSEYAAIAQNNGAFVRLEKDPRGEFKILGGLGSFPKNSHK